MGQTDAAGVCVQIISKRGDANKSMTQPTTSTHLLQMTVAAPSISKIVLALVSFDGGCLPSVSCRFLTGGRRVFGAWNEARRGKARHGQSKAWNMGVIDASGTHRLQWGRWSLVR